MLTLVTPIYPKSLALQFLAITLIAFSAMMAYQQVKQPAAFSTHKMNGVYLVRVIATLFSLVCTMTTLAGDTLPEHTIFDESALPNGVRLQINSDDMNLTKMQCTELINAYRDRALPDGQVSVHKPSPMKVFQGALLPFCVENFDGKGIIFNTDFHPDAE